MSVPGCYLHNRRQEHNLHYLLRRRCLFYHFKFMAFTHLCVFTNVRQMICGSQSIPKSLELCSSLVTWLLDYLFTGTTDICQRAMCANGSVCLEMKGTTTTTMGMCACNMQQTGSLCSDPLCETYFTSSLHLSVFLAF